MSKNLAITVLTWNDWENTTKCLESIFQSSLMSLLRILMLSFSSLKESCMRMLNLPKNESRNLNLPVVKTKQTKQQKH